MRKLEFSAQLTHFKGDAQLSPIKKKKSFWDLFSKKLLKVEEYNLGKFCSLSIYNNLMCVMMYEHCVSYAIISQSWINFSFKRVISHIGKRQNTENYVFQDSQKLLESFRIWIFLKCIFYKMYVCICKY